MLPERITHSHRAWWSRLAARPLLLAIAIACSGMSPPSNGDQIVVPVASDLQSDATHAQANHLVLLVIISRADCSYCDLLKREIIRPMIASGEYQDKVIIRELLLDARFSMIDFDGTRTPAANIAHRYQEWLTPTILFLDPNGIELTARRRGINTVEYYGHYLDKAINKALLKLERSEIH